MPEEKVLPKMKPMVLAEHHPTVVAIDPHFFPFHFLPLGSGGNSGRHCNRNTCAAASICDRKRSACVGGNRLLFSRCFLTLRVVGMGCLEGKENAQSHNCDAHRSEEHTSELQSHSDLVCRLLLEKKKIY